MTHSPKATTFILIHKRGIHMACFLTAKAGLGAREQTLGGLSSSERGRTWAKIELKQIFEAFKRRTCSEHSQKES